MMVLMAEQGMKPEEPEGFGRAIQSILTEKMTGIGVELSSGVRIINM
jgi:hypothetical protein